MKRYKTPEDYIESQTQWRDELITLRAILNSTELVETMKWGVPVYTVGGKNVVGLGSFKSYFGIWFFQGVFLRDPQKKLINAQEGTTKGMRQWRMQSADDIDAALVLQYLSEAIKNQKDGKQIKPEKKPLVIPEELENAFAHDSKLGAAFEELNLSKRRDFAEYISSAKKSETKCKRLDKIKPMILEKIGLNDKYK